ncbi:MAG: hypothetical protein ABFD80_00545 [Acidobacteriota bacterium]
MKKKRCPAPDELIAFFEAPPDAKNMEILDHILSCPDCRTVFSAIDQVRSQGEEIIRRLEGVEFSAEARARLERRAREEVRLIRARRRQAHPRSLRWLRIPAAGAALALLAVVVVLNHPWTRRGVETERLAGPAEIQLLQPRGNVLAAPAAFRWTRNEDVESCHLEIFDQNLDLLYRSPALDSGDEPLPEEARSRLQAGRIYFWKISATLKDHQTVESEFAKFVLQK